MKRIALFAIEYIREYVRNLIRHRSKQARVALCGALAVAYLCFAFAGVEGYGFTIPEALLGSMIITPVVALAMAVGHLLFALPFVLWDRCHPKD